MHGIIERSHNMNPSSYFMGSQMYGLMQVGSFYHMKWGGNSIDVMGAPDHGILDDKRKTMLQTK